MSLFLDAGPLFGAFDTKDSGHHVSARMIDEALKGVHGQIFTSGWVFAEAYALLLSRRRPLIAAQGMDALLAHKLVRILDVAGQDLAPIRELFGRHFARGLSLTDCSILHLMAKHRITTLATLDGQFDGLVPTLPRN